MTRTFTVSRIVFGFMNGKSYQKQFFPKDDALLQYSYDEVNEHLSRGWRIIKEQLIDITDEMKEIHKESWDTLKDEDETVIIYNLEFVLEGEG